MTANLIEANGYRMLALPVSGPMLSNVRDLTDLVGEALSQRATVVVVPVERLDPAFFQLRSGLAGEFVQKIVNYRLKLGVIGDVSDHSAASVAWRDFVREANRGRSVFFLPDLDALAARLSSLASSADIP
jgi:hypothetical protein